MLIHDIFWRISLNHSLCSFGVKIGACAFVITKDDNDGNYSVDKKGLFALESVLTPFPRKTLCLVEGKVSLLVSSEGN